MLPRLATSATLAVMAGARDVILFCSTALMVSYGSQCFLSAMQGTVYKSSVKFNVHLQYALE